LVNHRNEGISALEDPVLRIGEELRDMTGEEGTSEDEMIKDERRT